MAATSVLDSNAIITAVETAWSSLRRAGKPQAFEWTVVAAILATDASGSVPQVLALGAGNKCLGRASLRGGSARGLVLHDCHAEVLARRAFARGLIEEAAVHAKLCADGGACSRGLLKHDAAARLFSLRDGVRLHLYISDSPCGDAQRYADSSGGGERRTGAVAVGDSQSDEPVLRTKSGRSDIVPERRTHSMCCSDKVARWIAVGIAGSLASRLLDTGNLFHVDTVTVSADASALRVATGAAPATAAAASDLQVVCRCDANGSVIGADCDCCRAARAVGSEVHEVKQQLLWPQLAALRRALITRALPSIAAAQLAAGAAGAEEPVAVAPGAPFAEVRSLRLPALVVAARIFSCGRAATTTRMAASPAAKRPRPGGAASDVAPSRGASVAPTPALVGGSGSGAVSVPCGSAVAAWRDWGVTGIEVSTRGCPPFSTVSVAVTWPPALAEASGASPAALQLPPTFTSDAISASVGLPTGVAARVLEAAPPPVASASRISRVRMGRLYAGVCTLLGRCPACGNRTSCDACEWCRASADGPEEPQSKTLTLDACKGAIGVTPLPAYRRAAAAFLAATPAFARTWQHLPPAVAGADIL